MRNLKFFYEKHDEESWDVLSAREPKESRMRKFRKRREIYCTYRLDRFIQRFITKR